MRVEPTSLRHLGEQRRYFPDWTDGLLENGPELEADRNSYLAGGYAEEFGYRVQPGCSRGVPVLDEEPPELCREWRSQARSTHPGYPLRPSPFAGDLDWVVLEPDASAVSRRVPAHDDQSTQIPPDSQSHGTYVAVSHRPYGRADTARRAAIISTRLAAALVSLRWMVRHRAP